MKDETTFFYSGKSSENPRFPAVRAAAASILQLLNLLISSIIIIIIAALFTLCTSICGMAMQKSDWPAQYSECCVNLIFVFHQTFHVDVKGAGPPD